MTGTQQFLLGIASAVIAAASGYLLHKRSKVSDAISAQSGVASNHRAGTDQIIKGFNDLLDQAQETIKDDREVKQLLDLRIEKLVADKDRLEERLETFVTDLRACRAENARYRAKYGPLDDTPNPPNKGN